MKRRISKHHIRRALVTSSLPFRHRALPLARPSKSLLEDAVVWSDVERGSYTQRHPEFGTGVPAIRDFHVETEVATLANSEVTFSNQHAFDSDGRVLYERNLPFATLPVALELLEQPTDSRDVVTYLSNTWSTNFYHWLCLTLPLLRFYEAAGLPLGSLYVGRKLLDWQARSLELAGIDPDSAITTPTRAQQANVAVSTRFGGAVSPDAINWTRSKLLTTEPTPGHRRIFVARGQTTTRRLIDEQLIAKALDEEFGFEFVSTSNMTLDQEIELFSQAEAVVGTHGAGLTNVLFAPRGLKVLELRAFDADFATTSAFVELSCVLGHFHGALVGLPTETSGREISTNVRVEVESVLGAVEAMLKQVA